jgi:hypothetical protein
MENFMAISPRAQCRPGDMEADDRSQPMTGEQSATLKEISERAREPEAYSARLSQAAAAKRIRALRAKLAKDNSGAQHKPE